MVVASARMKNSVPQPESSVVALVSATCYHALNRFSRDGPGAVQTYHTSSLLREPQ